MPTLSFCSVNNEEEEEVFAEGAKKTMILLKLKLPDIVLSGVSVSNNQLKNINNF